MPSLKVRVHFDFASTLCYVAHRVMERLTSTLQELELQLVWTPVDLTTLLTYQRGTPIPETARQNAKRVAKELNVPVQIPKVWIDSRITNAAAILAENQGGVRIWREKVFSLHFEDGISYEDSISVHSLAQEIGIQLEAAEMADAIDEVEIRTRSAADELVTGVPTFMLGNWPFGGIQNETTMKQIFARFASRARRRLLN